MMTAPSLTFVIRKTRGEVSCFQFFHKQVVLIEKQNELRVVKELIMADFFEQFQAIQHGVLQNSENGGSEQRITIYVKDVDDVYVMSIKGLLN